MPIRINLLAEMKAAEELRRRDPVKRGIWVGSILVGVVLLWWGVTLIETMAAQARLNAVEQQLGAQSKEYDDLKLKEKKLAELNNRLSDINRIYTNRFLWGSVLNALQQSVVEGVQLISFKGDQSSVISEPTKAKSNEAGKIIQFAKPGQVIHKIHLEFNAKDSSATPGDQVGKYKEALSRCTLFKSMITASNEIVLKNLSPPSLDGASGKSAVTFSLDFRPPDRTIK